MAQHGADGAEGHAIVQPRDGAHVPNRVRWLVGDPGRPATLPQYLTGAVGGDHANGTAMAVGRQE